jgi:hypothetical protein
MTEEEYQAAKQAIATYEQKKAAREEYVEIRNTADTLIVVGKNGKQIVLKGAEPIAAIIDYVNAKIAEIDGEKEAITAPKITEV